MTLMEKTFVTVWQINLNYMTKIAGLRPNALEGNWSFSAKSYEVYIIVFFHKIVLHSLESRNGKSSVKRLYTRTLRLQSTFVGCLGLSRFKKSQTRYLI